MDAHARDKDTPPPSEPAVESRRLDLWIPFAAGLCAGLLIPASSWLRYSPPGGRGQDLAPLLALFGTLALVAVFVCAVRAVVMLTVSVWYARWRGRRLQQAVWVGVPLVTYGCLSASFMTMGPVREKAEAEIQSRGQLIIDALADYHEDHGAYPGRLMELVPEYLTKIPASPCAAYERFAYIPDEPEATASRTGGYELRLFGLTNVVVCGTWVYWPSEDYPEELYRGMTRRIGRWAYTVE